MSPIGKRHYRGFTLIELAVVLSIIGLSLAIAEPHLAKLLPQRGFTHEAEGLLNTLNKTRLEAMKSGTTAQMTFLDGANGYAINGIQHTTASKVVFKPQTRNDVHTLTFYTDGTVTPGLITLQQADHTLGIQTNWFTGQAEIVRSSQH